MAIVENVQFRLSYAEGEKLEAVIDHLKKTATSAVTPKKLFLQAVQRILDENGIVVEEESTEDLFNYGDK